MNTKSDHRMFPEHWVAIGKEIRLGELELMRPKWAAENQEKRWREDALLSGETTNPYGHELLQNELNRQFYCRWCHVATDMHMLTTRAELLAMKHQLCEARPSLQALRKQEREAEWAAFFGPLTEQLEQK